LVLHLEPLNTTAVTVTGGRELVLTGGADGIARVFDIGTHTTEPVAESGEGRNAVASVTNADKVFSSLW